MEDRAPLNEAEQKERHLTRTADHLSDFGTLTSLGSTGLWLAEPIFIKGPIPKPLLFVSLAGVAVGMGAVITAFGMRNKAGKIALQNDRQMHEAASHSR